MPQRLLAAALLSALISSCSSGKAKTHAAPQAAVTLPDDGTNGKNPDAANKAGSKLTDIDSLTKADDKGDSLINKLPVVKHDVAAVHFDYDSAAVTAAELAKVQAMAAFLAAHPDYICVVKGYSDERGSEEYNRALSERRALAVKEALIQANAALAARLSSQSMGEEAATQNGNDAAWSADRRAEFEVLDASKAK